MRIIIHRGINQIGGCITEIQTSKSSIVIDLGQNLPDKENTEVDFYSKKTNIENLTKNVNAVFYTHYHGDHLGHFHLVPVNVKQYIGNVAKKVTICKYERLNYAIDMSKEIQSLQSMISFEPEEKIRVGDIEITPFFVSHSAYDSYMFLIEAEGKSILHTGDYRGHGYLSKGLLPTIEKLILKKMGSVDILITEGTMLSRMDERVRPENELKSDAIKIMSEYKNVFVLCSSTDMERLATFHAANQAMRNRPFICDDFQKKVLEIFSASAGTKSTLFRFEDVYSFQKENSKLLHWMRDRGFCMLVRPTDKFKDFYSHIEKLIEKEQTVLIFSMWKEYINSQGKHSIDNYLDFVKRFPKVVLLHTSGHASSDCLADVCNLVDPGLGIIPIHSEISSDFSKLNIHEHLKRKIILSSQMAGDIEIEVKNQVNQNNNIA